MCALSHTSSFPVYCMRKPPSLPLATRCVCAPSSIASHCVCVPLSHLFFPCISVPPSLPLASRCVRVPLPCLLLHGVCVPLSHLFFPCLSVPPSLPLASRCVCVPPSSPLATWCVCAPSLTSFSPCVCVPPPSLLPAHGMLHHRAYWRAKQKRLEAAHLHGQTQQGSLPGQEGIACQWL